MLATAAILFIRKPDGFLNPQFWAEDGTCLFVGARQDGTASIFKTYSRGQTFLAQRLIAYALSAAPVQYTPHFYMLAALAAALAVGAYVARCRLKSRLRWAMALAIVLVYTGGEIYLCLANLHWLLALVLIIMAASPDPVTVFGKFAEAVTAALLSLTGPFSVCLWPLFILRAFRRRTGHALAVLAIVAAGAGWQLLNVDATRRPGRFDPWDAHWQGFLGRHFSGSLFLGEWALGLPIAETWFAVLSIVLVWHLAGYLRRHRDPEVATFVLGGLLTLAAGACVYRTVPYVIDTPRFRYYFIPAVCMAWTLLLIAERSTRLRTKACMALALMLLAASTRFVFDPLPDLHWAEASRGIGGRAACDVPINPPPWTVHYVPQSK